MLPAADATLWGSPRGSGNRSRIDALATGVASASAPLSTGSHVRWVRRSAPDRVLLHLGSILRSVTLAGTDVWARTDLGVSRIVGYSVETSTIVAVSRRSMLVVLDGVTGDTLWEFTTPETRDLTGVGSVRLVTVDGSTLLLISPNYSTIVTCVDLSDPARIDVRWEHEFGDSIDAGFGPVLVVADALGLGRPQLVASSRVGDTYDDDNSTLPTERLVLGRTDGQLYQVVLDLDDGSLLADVSYRPDPGPYPCARPYGLFEVVEGSDIVLASCQVEEYVSITAAPRLARRWGWFVERDWPVDEQELRPQSSSVSVVTDDGRARLVVGHWDGDAWATLVLDMIGENSTGTSTRVDDRYFWGAADLDGDGIAELIVSPESQRRPGGVSTVELVHASTGATRASIADVRIVTTDDDDLPAHRTFHAERRGAVVLRGKLVLVDAQGTTVLWNGSGTQELWPHPIVRVDDRGGQVCLTDDRGSVIVLDDELGVEAVIAPSGRTPVPLLWTAPDGTPELVVDTATGVLEGWSVVAGEPAHDWSIDGDRASLHRDAIGDRWLVAARSTADGSTVAAYRMWGEHPVTAWSVDFVDKIDHVLAFGASLSVFVGLRVAPHTTRTVMLDADGAALWHDEDRSAWASDPLAFTRGGVELVAYDDHGVLITRDARTGTMLSSDDWTAAYTTPVDLGDGLLRIDGSHGLQSASDTGDMRWRANYDVFALHPGNSSILLDEGRAHVAAPRRDGVLDIIDIETGSLGSSVAIGPQAERRPTLAIGDTVVAGLVSGLLVAYTVSGAAAWAHDLGTAVESLAAVLHDGVVTLAVGTADGTVRLLTLASGDRVWG